MEQRPRRFVAREFTLTLEAGSAGPVRLMRQRPHLVTPDGHLLREATCGPRKRRLSNQYSVVTPSGGVKPQGMKRVRPAVNLPNHAADFQFDVVGQQTVSEVTAVFFDRVGRFVFAAQQRDGTSGQGRELLGTEAAAECAERLAELGPSRRPRRWLN